MSSPMFSWHTLDLCDSLISLYPELSEGVMVLREQVIFNQFGFAARQLLYSIQHILFTFR